MSNRKSGKISYHRSVPDHHLEEIKKFVEPCAWLIPFWMQECIFFYDTTVSGESDNAVTAKNYVRRDYIYSCITIAGPWITSNDYAKQFDMVHEFVHCHNGELHQWVGDCIDALLDDYDCKPHKTVIKNTFREKIESETQSLTLSIMEKVFPHIPPACSSE